MLSNMRPSPVHAVDDETGSFVCDPALTFRHDYPPTKLMFVPDPDGTRPDLLATTGERGA